MTASAPTTASLPTNQHGPKRPATLVPLHPLLAERWSPRAFDDSHQLVDDHLSGLLEAARWAPSANNTQPWRFVVARRGTDLFARVFAALRPGNQLWAGNASALVLLAAEVVDEDGASRSYAMYDTGQAAAHMTAQATAYGLSTHQMAGFDADAMTAATLLPSGVVPVVVMAVGQHDPKSLLPEALALREQAPRTRRPLHELVLSNPAAERLSA